MENVLTDWFRYELIDETPENPMVCVAMLTYNHQEFIKQALDSILMQKTDFSIKVVIADDFSTDDTRKILIEYQKKHPEIFKLVFQKKNLGHIENNLDLYRNIGGKYIAVLEGDDYWTDPIKLQKQVDFLESNPDYSFCCHNNSIVSFETGEVSIRNDEDDPEEDIDLKSVIIKRTFASGSLVYRMSALKKETIDMMSKVMNFDYALIILLAEQGSGRYFPDNMSTYRRHDGGVWTGIKDFKFFHKLGIKFYGLLLKHFKDPEIRKIIHYKINENHRDMAQNQIKNGQIIRGIYRWIRHYDFPKEKGFGIPFRMIWIDIKSGIKKKLKISN